MICTSGSLVKKPPASVGEAIDGGSIPGSGGSPGVGNGNLLQYFYLKDFMNRGAWQTIVHGITKSGTGLNSCLCMHLCYNGLVFLSIFI